MIPKVATDNNDGGKPRATCREVCESADRLGSFELEDAATPADEALRVHLSMCPPCVEYVRQIAVTRDALRLALRPTLRPTPPACRDALLASFEAWKRSR